MRRKASLLRNVSFANGLLPGLGMYPLRGYSYSHVCTCVPCTCGRAPFESYNIGAGYEAIESQHRFLPYSERVPDEYGEVKT